MIPKSMLTVLFRGGRIVPETTFEGAAIILQTSIFDSYENGA
jgi:hypothetical protein